MCGIHRWRDGWQKWMAVMMVGVVNKMVDVEMWWAQMGVGNHKGTSK